ncbi:uncharacterized protein EV154DRAFT_594377 [Mucor mucedo]|uniref:uncharacterized protein n=1 Tax=Mucor mucedo TaxID=29922 RepID=UPI00221F8727|nr:uncharacterized protein EV154DRAFT_594377 [Mucor mucedo]KAI7895746.1 hypothetical protein EV154DRAFT_594377 [Mucor mucedo]
MKLAAAIHHTTTLTTTIESIETVSLVAAESTITESLTLVGKDPDNYALAQLKHLFALSNILFLGKTSCDPMLQDYFETIRRSMYVSFGFNQVTDKFLSDMMSLIAIINVVNYQDAIEPVDEAESDASSSVAGSSNNTPFTTTTTTTIANDTTETISLAEAKTIITNNLPLRSIDADNNMYASGLMRFRCNILDSMGSLLTYESHLQHLALSNILFLNKIYCDPILEHYFEKPIPKIRLSLYQSLGFNQMENFPSDVMIKQDPGLNQRYRRPSPFPYNSMREDDGRATSLSQSEEGDQRA